MAPKSMPTPKTNSTMPQMRLMLMPSEWRYISTSEPVAAPIDGEEHAEEREHDANWPANIESHNFLFSTKK